MDARIEARVYYDANAAILKDVYPREMFEVYLRKEMGDHVEPDKCWDAATKLLAELKDYVQKERERRQRETDRKTSRLQAIEEEIDELNHEITLQRNSPMDPDVAENEILAIQEKIGKLETEKTELEKS